MNAAACSSRALHKSLVPAPAPNTAPDAGQYPEMKTRLKVLHFIPHLSGGGAQRQLAYLSSELVRLGHEVHIAYLTPGPHPDEHRDSRVFLHQLGARGNYDLRLLLQIGRLMRDISPHVVQTWLLQMDILAGLIAVLRGVPWVLREPTSNSFWTSERGLPGLKARIRALLGRHARAVVSNSQNGDEFWRARRKGQNCFVIPNGLPIGEISATTAIAGPVAGALDAGVVLYAGRFDERQKNITRMMTALLEVARRSPVTVVLCGEGPALAEAQRLVARAALSTRFIFTGHTSDVWQWMKRANAFVSVSEFEGQPNTVMEAMACGCPLVLSDIPGHRALLDETMAVFVDALDASVIADGITRVLERESCARARAEKAKERSRTFSMDKMASAYEAVYRNCCSGR